MVSTFLVISIVVPIIVIAAFRNRQMEIIEVGFRQEMEADVVDVEDEQSHRQHAQPPPRRGRHGNQSQ